MLRLLLPLLLVSACVAYWDDDMNDLKELVSAADRAAIKALDRDRMSPRSSIRQQFDAIVARQTPEVQSAYNQLVQAKQAIRRQIEQQRMMSAQSSGVADVVQQLDAVRNDMSLSSSAAKQGEKAIKAALTAQQRMQLASLYSQYDH